MGKYSLDAFEVHPLVKLRPAMKASGESCFRLLELDRSELEPEKGKLLPPPPVGQGQVVLRLNLAGTEDIADACGFIRRMGACYAGGKALAAVVVTEGFFSGTALDQLLQAYRQGFEGTFLLVEPGSVLAEACSQAGMTFGLWLKLERGILPLRRSIAQGNLARVWENRPVYLWTENELTEEELDAARRWHTSGANVPTTLGPRMTLRRMMFPRDLTAGGVMPLRLWWQNLGTAPLYRDVEICLELRKDLKRFPIWIPEAGFRPGMGDSTFNTAARLPDIQGTFALWCGLKCHGTMLKLSMEAPEEDGMYAIGQITLDNVLRPHLATMWEDSYADGYYPLEDPAQPE